MMRTSADKRNNELLVCSMVTIYFSFVCTVTTNDVKKGQTYEF